MTFDELLTQVYELLQRQGRLSYRALKVRFQLDDDLLEALKDELIYAQCVAADEDGRVVVWMEERASTSLSGPAPAGAREREPLSYTPAHLAEKILTSRSALEGERKQVTVLFADLQGSMELLADRDPEEARQLLDPVLERMIEAVHRYEGTVNQVMEDGIMALFGAPIAHEDHAVRACYAALRMQETVTHCGDEMQPSHYVPTMVFAEVLYLAEKHRISLSLPTVAEHLEQFQHYREYPMSFAVIQAAAHITDIPELHDRLIAGTARFLHLDLITNDPTIQASTFVRTVW